MASIISASINLSKIDKSRIKKDKKGDSYYAISIFCNDDANQYQQDVSIVESQTKEESQAKVKKKYIGNGKTVWNSNGNVVNKKPSESNQVDNSQDFLPF